jgi:quinol monooxygenase YgiN
MFGTIAKMKVKPGSYEKMAEVMKGFEERPVKGFLFNAVYRSQSNPDEVWLVVGFEDEATYRANADDPRTDEMSKKFQTMMTAPPEWHDGEIVSMTRAEDRAST